MSPAPDSGRAGQRGVPLRPPALVLLGLRSCQLFCISGG